MEFIPFNRHSSHWVLYVLERKLKRYRYYDSLGNLPDMTFMGKMAFLMGAPNAPRDRWTRLRQECPSQEDGYNCGVFVCAIAESLAENIQVPSHLSYDDLGQFRDKVVSSFLAGEIQTPSGMHT